jgi:hypothetical protein
LWLEMTQSSTAATEAARRFWAHHGLHADTPEDMAAGAEQGCARLRAVLTRWIGADGYRALINRALEQARATHPAIAHLHCQSGDLEEVAAAVGGHSAAKVREGVLDLVALLVDLLGRLIGEEMAVRLVEQAGAGSAPSAPSTVTEGLRHG